ncbi:MAG: folate-binding protein YgfZ [Sphingomonadales bacterium]|nr:folate-binding protein YgfZ [Sphingomonadales bacterium]
MTSTPPHTRLPSRGVIEIAGDDRRSFLQGLVTNDVMALTPGNTTYAALLTPQGKYLFDFLVVDDGERLLLDVEAARRDDLIRRLMLYKLRAKVTITDRTAELAVAITPDGREDPRHPLLGRRAILPYVEAEKLPADESAYQAQRLRLGIPEGSGDFIVDKLLILEGNLDYLNGVSFKKGCYVGQELTARMKHRGKVRKRLLPVQVTGALPPDGTPITEDGKEIGELRGGLGARAIAYLRLDDLAMGKSYRCGDAMVTPERPAWLPETALNPGQEEKIG